MSWGCALSLPGRGHAAVSHGQTLKRALRLARAQLRRWRKPRQPATRGLQRGRPLCYIARRRPAQSSAASAATASVSVLGAGTLPMGTIVKVPKRLAPMSAFAVALPKIQLLGVQVVVSGHTLPAFEVSPEMFGTYRSASK